MSINNNIDNSSFISPLERKGVVDLTKNFIRNTLYEKLKNSNIPEQTKLKISPSNFNIDNQNLYTMFKLEYTIIDDFLIRTKLNYTHSIFNNEIKSLINPLIPFDDKELMDLLGINIKQLNSLRFKWNNNSNDSSDLIKSTYLYEILNSHTKMLKIDEEAQTNDVPIYDNALYSSDVRGGPTTSSDIEIRLKNIEEKYNKKLREGNGAFSFENKLKKYQDEAEQRYEVQLKNEMERFKSIELSKLKNDLNEEYKIKYEKKIKEIEEEYKKEYDELKKLQKELQEYESKLKKEYEERNTQLNLKYKEREKNLDNKEYYLDKYKNDMDISVQRIKLNEELKSLQESINKGKEFKKKNPNNQNYQEINPVINNEIDYLKKEIEELKKGVINRQPYLQNNFINKEEDKKMYYINNNNIKPTKESVLNSLNNLNKNNNSNNLNKSRYSYSQSGSGLHNVKIHNRKDIKKRLEELEEEQDKINREMRDDFRRIINGDLGLLIVDKEEYMKMNNNKYDINAIKYKPVDIYSDNRNYTKEEIKTNNNININNKKYDNKNIEDNLYYKNDYKTDYTNDNKNNYKNEYKDDYKNDHKNDYINDYKNDFKNEHKNDYNDINNIKNISTSKGIETNKNNYNTKISNSGLFNNNINNSVKKNQNNSITNKSNSHINKNVKESYQTNNIGGYNIGGYNIGGYMNNNNSNNNNNNNYQIKSNISESIIEENIEGDVQNNKKENSRRNNNFMSSNRYKEKTKNEIKEEIEGENAGSNNNSKEINNKINNNNINVNKSNKFNNYDYNEVIDNEEIDENINYGESEEKKMDMGISGSISGIVKKQAEISESAGGFVGLFQLQSHAGGLGMNDKESYGDFEFSKGKNNTNNKKGNDKQSKMNPESGDIPEEISSDSRF